MDRRTLDRQLYSLTKIAYHLGRLDTTNIEEVLREFAKENPKDFEVIERFFNSSKKRGTAKVKVVNKSKQLPK